LIDNVFRGNHTYTDGGAIYFYASTASLQGNEIFDNQASRGAGLYVAGGSDVSISSTTIISNTANGFPNRFFGHGGGVCVPSGQITLTNSILAGNHALDAGGAAFLRGPAVIVHTTIADNDGGDGSGVVVTGTLGAASLTNTIIAGHTVGITVTAGNRATLEGTLWDNDTDWGGAGDLDVGTVNLWGDPAFLDPEGHDYHITANSAALNAGVDAGVLVDLDGDVRPLWGMYDIGADEFVRRIYLPLLMGQPAE
jgi:hypothetical protein